VVHASEAKEPAAQGADPAEVSPPLTLNELLQHPVASGQAQEPSAVANASTQAPSPQPTSVAEPEPYVYQEDIAAPEAPPPEMVATPPPQAHPTEPPVTPPPLPVQPNAAPDPHIIVFGYHQFQPGSRNKYSMEPSVFREQLQYFKDHNIRVISREDLAAFLRGEKTWDTPCVMLTVDDGYLSVHRYAEPILAEFGYPWTFFCYTEFVGNGGSAVNWNQLQQMSQAGVDIQSHTKSHPILTKRSGKNDVAYITWLWAELFESRSILESKLGKPVTALAYSYGSWNETVQAKAVEAGYQMLFTVKGEPVTRRTSPFAIPRYILTKDNEKFMARYMTPPPVRPSAPAPTAQPPPAKAIP
jgi:peptidoglycan/xylan/chitin deacetylase (PgdA/CDA1 family)